MIEVIAKVESHDSVPNLAEIVEASDAVMVARGDLGAARPHAPARRRSCGCTGRLCGQSRDLRIGAADASTHTLHHLQSLPK